MKTVIRNILILSLAFGGCTKLEENLHGQTSGASLGASNVESLLAGAYVSLRSPYQGPFGWWALQQATTDETITPTRGGDWDDNGEWRALFLHRWQTDHVRVHNVFRDLNGVSYAATDLLQFEPTAGQEAEARFLRALAQYTILDGWGQVPYREPGEEVTGYAQVRQAAEQIDYLRSELTAIDANLPDNSNILANKAAAKVLLMKLYLNKGMFLNRQLPTFDQADLTEVLSLADDIINSGKYQLADNYFDNFTTTNRLSLENIFLSANTGGADAGDLGSMWNVTSHYNMNPSGWNGFATLSNFYDKFESTDQRRGGPYPGMTNLSGVPMGFLVGQQYNAAGVALLDRRGNALAFTPEVHIIERGNNLELTGIRVMKYVVDYANLSSGNPQNDWVIFRYADVLLMKAEALLRLGRAEEALSVVNSLRQKRGASPFSTLSLDLMLDELGREFFWESHRRTDLIRFGKYLDAWQEKPASDMRVLLFPIPLNQMGNPNYIQNPGY